MNNWLRYENAPELRDVWDLNATDGLHLMVLSFGPGKPYCAVAGICEAANKNRHDTCTDFVFDTREQAMQEAERLGEKCRAAFYAEKATTET